MENKRINVLIVDVWICECILFLFVYIIVMYCMCIVCNNYVIIMMGMLIIWGVRFY